MIELAIFGFILIILIIISDYYWKIIKPKMNRYFIEDSDGAFWCENKFGYWSSLEQSLEHRFEGNIFWVYPMYLLIKSAGIKCKLKQVK